MANTGTTKRRKRGTKATMQTQESDLTSAPIRRADQRLLKQLCDRDRRGIMDELGVIIEEAARQRGLIQDEPACSATGL